MNAAHAGRALVALALAAQVVACHGGGQEIAPGHIADGGHGGASAAAGGAPPDAAAGAGGTGTDEPSMRDAGGGDASTTGTAGSTGVMTGAAGAGVAGVTGAAGAGAAGAGVAQDAGAFDGPYDSGGVPCQVVIEPVFPTSFFALESGPASSLQVRASANGYKGAPRWLWSVEYAGGPAVADVPFTVLDDSGATIELKLAKPGSYQITARVAGAPQCDAVPVGFPVAKPRIPSFRFRVTPPSAARLPARETVQMADELAAGAQTINLGDTDHVSVVSVAPVDGRGHPLPSYVRLTSPSFGLEIEGSTARGPLVATLADELTYDVLIVPDGAVAPLLITGTPDVIVQKLSLTVGVSVSGEARDGAGQPVVGARVILRDGARPSTVGVSDASGAFSILTREGPLSAVVVPPAGSGLPEARLSATAGLVIFANKPAKLAMTWADVPRASLAMTVRASDGTPVAGVRVHAESSAELPSVGTLSVRGGAAADVELTATGLASADAVTDERGAAALGVLPTGSYTVVVAPPVAAGAAMATTIVELPAAGLSHDVTLPAPVAFTRSLEPPHTAAGTRVTAIDLGALAPAASPTAVADAEGRYTLSLSPGRAYELLVEPPSGRGLARAVIRRVIGGAPPESRSDTVPAALVWKGTVVGLGHRVAGAVVQVFCVAPSSTCLDPSIAVAQGVTGSDGTLELSLPDFAP